MRIDKSPYIGQTRTYECHRCGNKPCQVRISDGIMEDRTRCVADGIGDAQFEEVGE